MEHPEQFSFTINEVDQQTFWFDVDAKGRPIKLGDGSFGVVYRVHDRNDVRHAVKLLYIKQTLTQLSTFQLTDLMMDAFQRQFSLADDSPIMTKLRPIHGPSVGFIGLLLALKGLDLSDPQLVFLLRQIEQNNNLVLEDAEELQRMIEKFFGLDVRTLDTLISTADAEEAAAKRGRLLGISPKSLRFDDLIFSQLTISVNGGWPFSLATQMLGNR